MTLFGRQERLRPLQHSHPKSDSSVQKLEGIKGMRYIKPTVSVIDLDVKDIVRTSGEITTETTPGA